MTIKKITVGTLYFLCVLMIAGCKKERPDDILSKEAMTQILLEVYLGEGKISSLGIKRDSSLAVFDEYEKLIFKKYNIEREQYKKSLSYYYDHPVQLEEIYNGVLDSLNIRDQKLKESNVGKEENIKPLQEVE